MTDKRNYIPSVLLIVCAILFSLVPLVFMRVNTGSAWKGIVPNIVNDDLYYLSKIDDINRGLSSAGNPYFYEHRNDLSPTTTYSDRIAALILKTGISEEVFVVSSVLIWTTIFFLLVACWFSKFIKSEWLVLLGTMFVYLQVANLLFRPVYMQVVYPAYLVFCIALLLWWREPSRSRLVALAITISLSFYLYAFLIQVVFATLGVFILWKVINRQYRSAGQLLLSAVVGVVLAIPALLDTYKAISLPLYWSTFERIGLVHTHWPTIEVWYNGRWLVLGVLLLVVLSRLIRKSKTDSLEIDNINFLIGTGLGFLVVAVSNMVTGKEMEIAVHITRFADIWRAVVLVYVATLLYKYRKGLFIEPRRTLYISIILLFVFALSAVVNFRRSVMSLYYRIIDEDVKTVQMYAEPLTFLEKQTKEPSVVWAPPEIGEYVPYLTKDYVLYSSYGMINFVTKGEVEERFLVSRYPEDLTPEILKKLYPNFRNTNDEAILKSRAIQSRICSIFSLQNFVAICDPHTIKPEPQGEDPKYFIALAKRYKEDIVPKIGYYLDKYKVKYVIRTVSDKNNTSSIYGKEVYKDPNFVIYERKEK